MYLRHLLWAALAAMLSTFLLSSSAHAQATRTWVSGVGDDVNPCSRTAPCKTFAGAISKTATGGEINCLDPGGYGTLTITKSITVDCTGTFGSVLNSSGINGIVINDSATGSPRTIEVTLRGISFNGAGTTPGLNGVRFFSGKSLVLDRVTIENNNSAGGTGVIIAPSAGTATVVINDSVIIRNGTSTSGAGVMIRPTGTGSAIVSISNSNVSENLYVGIRAFGLDTSGNLTLNITNTVASNNASVGVLANGNTNANLTKVSLVGNGAGLQADSPAIARIGDSMVSGNGSGISGNVATYQNNQLGGNGIQGSGTPIAPAQVP